MPPIYMTSTFETGNAGGFDYTRSGNPNFRNLQNAVASLEGAQHCTVFGSGVAAITAVASTLKSGDLVVAEENVYGCTYRLFDKVFAKFGVQVRYLDLANKANHAQVAALKPTLVWLESPTNPLLKCIDIAAIAKQSHKVGAAVLVDNTFASSYLQRPLELGADLSLLSTTKYANGHSDALGGAVCSNDAAWQDQMIFAQKALGLQPSPFDAWLVQRGLKTLSLRMERHSSNALELAKRLEKARGVKWVRYPFLKSHPQHAIAKKQMRAGSGLIVADLGLSTAQTATLLRSLHLFCQAESLGGIESLICHPATMTHASVPRAVRESVGITDGVIRFSVGLEDVEDQWKDIEAALKAARKKG
jgi:cystathionine beta-lyase/cystathionine gamma-synthase